MDLKHLLPLVNSKQIKLLEGIEGVLNRRRRMGTIAGIVTFASLIYSIIIIFEKFHKVTGEFVISLGKFIKNLILGNWDKLSANWKELSESIKLSFGTYETVGIIVLVIAFLAYYVLRRTSFLLKESENPFRYTFSIEPFKRVKEKPEESFAISEDDQFHKADERFLHLLHHDLMERLNDRIQRLSLLESKSLDSKVQEKLSSHIHIEGYFTIRETKNRGVAIELMPRIRIGPPGKSSSLIYPIKCPLKKEGKNIKLDVGTYDHIVERVYSTIANEIYGQIESDIKEKIKLFPTAYLRAVALFHEAEDFARSNTIDAYDRAIELYKETLRYFNITSFKWITSILIRFPILIWRLGVKFTHMHARVHIGYAKCLIFRRHLSALTGRQINPLFEIPSNLKKIIGNLEIIHKRIKFSMRKTNLNRLMAFLTFPKDSWLRHLFIRPLQPLFKRQKRILFDAYLVDALAHYELAAFKKAEEFRKKAKAVAPDIREKNALYILTRGVIETSLDKKILYFNKATELAPDFQIAHYFLALFSEMKFRADDKIVLERAKGVIDEYDEVLKSNPGNILALAAQGYLWWLLGNKKDLDNAKEKFREGCEVKAIASETFIGQLNYGLARIAAREGRFNKSYYLFTQAISADPGIAAFSVETGKITLTSYFVYIDTAMLERFYYFKDTVENRIKNLKKDENTENTFIDEMGHTTFSKDTIDAVHSFVLNDYGNACLTYFHRFGNHEKLQEAIEAFEEAIEKNKENAVAYYNLQNAYGWYGKFDKILECLANAESLAPMWPAVSFELEKSRVQKIRQKISSKEKEIEDKKQEIQNMKEQLQRESDFKKMPESKDKKMSEPKELRGSDDDLIIYKKTPALAELGRLKDDLAKKDRKRRLLEEEFIEITRASMSTVSQRSKLSEFFNVDKQEIKINNIIKRLKKVEKDRVDDTDIRTLITFGEILLTDANNYKNLIAAIKIFSYILSEIYPEDFDSNLNIYRVYHLMKIELKNLTEKRKKLSDERLSEIKKIFFDIIRMSGHKRYYYHIRLKSILEYFLKINLLLDLREILIKEQDEYRKQLKNNLKFWIETNPLCFYLLYWYRHIEERDKELKKFFREIAKHTEKKDTYHNVLGNVYYFMKEYKNAVSHYRLAIRHNPKNNECKNEIASCYNSIGNDFFRHGGYKNAIRNYNLAIKFKPEETTYYSNLVSACENLIDTAESVEPLDKTIKALQKAYKLNPKKDYKKVIKKIQIKKRDLSKYGKKLLDMLPVVTPIAAEVAGNLIPHIERKEGRLSDNLSKHLNNMRERVLNEFGVKVPGIRFRGNETDLPDGTYIVMLMETPLVSGNISPNQKFLLSNSEKLTSLKISGNEAINPLTGDKGYWIEHKDWEKIKGNGIKSWDAIEYLVRHLEAVIKKNLSEFFGHQEVMNMLEEKMPKVYEEIKKKTDELSLLTSILRGLLSEEIPITEFEKIVDKFHHLKRDGQNLLNIIETIRSMEEIRPNLPGNNERYSFYKLDEHFESEIERSIYPEKNHSILAMEPEKCQDVLTTVRNEIGSQLNIALLIENAKIRPFVRKLIGLEFPNIQVLSRDELLPELNSKILGEIELQKSK